MENARTRKYYKINVVRYSIQDCSLSNRFLEDSTIRCILLQRVRIFNSRGISLKSLSLRRPILEILKTKEKIEGLSCFVCLSLPVSRGHPPKLSPPGGSGLS